jgi:hypothetical protein
MAGVGSRRKGLNVDADFDTKGRPIIKRRPVPVRLVKAPKFLGSYFFGDAAHRPLAFNEEKYYEENQDRLWCVIATVDVQTQPGVKTLPESTLKTLTKVFKTPASALWQSECGRYMLYPFDDKFKFNGFPFDDDDTESRKWVMPSCEWQEYYCVPAVAGKKFNCRNPCDWASFQETLRLLKKKKTFTSDDVRKKTGDRMTSGTIAIKVKSKKNTKKTSKGKPINSVTISIPFA